VKRKGGSAVRELPRYFVLAHNTPFRLGCFDFYLSTGLQFSLYPLHSSCCFVTPQNSSVMMPFKAIFPAIIHRLRKNYVTSKPPPNCSLINFPTEILSMIDNYLPPIDGLSLRVTCRTLFIKLPRFDSSQLGPDGPNIVSSTFHFWEICTLERQNCLLDDSKGSTTFCKPQLAKGRRRYPQYACSYCRDAHARKYFSKTQLLQRPETRVCVGAETPLRFCRHRFTNHADLVEYAKTGRPTRRWYASYANYPTSVNREPCVHRADLFIEDRLILNYESGNRGQIRLEHVFRFRQAGSWTTGIPFLLQAWDYIWEHEHLCPRISRRKARIWFNDALKRFRRPRMREYEVRGLSCEESGCACTHTLNVENFQTVEIKLSEKRCFYPFAGPTSKTWIEELGV